MTDTEPAASAGTEVTRFNALKHGVLSRYTVLPWEDADEYRALVAALADEHQPRGPTEEHLVEELAGILWRKRRLRLAEAALHRRGLWRSTGECSHTAAAALAHQGVREVIFDVPEAVRMDEAETQLELAELPESETAVGNALNLLAGDQNDAYEAAVAALPEDTQAWWAAVLAPDAEDQDEGEALPTADAEGLRRFLEGEVLPRLAKRRQELANAPLVREQAFGEALDPDKLERLGRYEVHLDRKLERMLAMLLRLKDLRAGEAPG